MSPSATVSDRWICSSALRRWASVAMARSPSGGTVYTACGPKPRWIRPSRPSMASNRPHASSNMRSHVSPFPELDTSKMPGVYMARMPESTIASTTGPGWRYCSQVVVVPLHKSSAAPSTMPQYTSSSVSNASRGQTVSYNQRSRGSPSPALRTSVIGEWPWQLTSPGMSRPPSWWTSAPGAGGTCQGSPTHEMRPSSISTAPGTNIVPSASTVKTASATSRHVTARRRTDDRTGHARPGWPPRCPRPSVPRCRRGHGCPPRPRRQE